MKQIYTVIVFYTDKPTSNKCGPTPYSQIAIIHVPIYVMIACLYKH